MFCASELSIYGPLGIRFNLLNENFFEYSHIDFVYHLKKTKKYLFFFKKNILKESK